MTRAVVVMGVAGCGKSILAQALAQHTQLGSSLAALASALVTRDPTILPP
ncbi:hypothetical protein sphantq_02430 [Sphingobium sp. AntQ-1]|nr:MULTISPECIES: hypothetical protein [unclassified Sphingobium]MBJ7375743.1 hypothetical protein [Sphingobium sp.]WCP13989.1 hypothetical protein sphantq_02430 [Sphingobium sp. AntQ-1]